MLVREMMTKNPAACLATDTGTVAGLMMAQQKCGFIPVVADRESLRVIGVLTDRDLLLHLVKTNRAPSEVPVEACMTKEVKAAAPEADLEEAARVMEEAAVHRLPIIENGRLAGILSVNDIALAAKKQWESSAPHVAERQLTEILEAIASAR